MPFQKVQSEKLAQSVVRQIELLILRGILRPGERLPSERDLSDRLGVSRPILRTAIAELQENGLIAARPGAGLFVCEELAVRVAPALARLFSVHEEAVFDYVAFRRDIEGLAIERAARLGSDTDLKVVDTAFRRMEAAHHRPNPAEEAELDARFHMAIIEASHNAVMLHMMRAMFDLLKEGVFFNRQVMFKQQTTREMLLDQHRAINDALQARDAGAARQAVTAHLDFVEAALRDQRQAAKNETVAQMRYAHERGR